MECSCFCGAEFATVCDLAKHGADYGHRIMCSCGKLLKDMQSVRIHRNGAAPSHPRHSFTEHPALIALLMSAPPSTVALKIECKACHKILNNATGLAMHIKDKHSLCSTCKQNFGSDKQLQSHQKAAGHCYCADHDEIFDSENALRTHKLQNRCASGFECITCNRAFGTQQGLDDHLKDKKHPEIDTPNYSVKLEQLKKMIEERNLQCESCNKGFKSLAAFRQHKNSVKHKPLSDLQCPLSEGCGRTFTSPSALIFHLESGGCKSGMNRLKLNALVHVQDTARHITAQKHAANAIAMANSVASLSSGITRLSLVSRRSSQSRVLLTPHDSDAASVISSTDSGVLIPTPCATTSRSRASSIGGVILTPSSSTADPGEWSHITSSLRLTPNSTTRATSSIAATITQDSDQRWPCNMCTKTFCKKQRLLDHLNSPTHAQKLFHCPTTVVGLQAGGHHAKKFKTLSGMAQHIEVGSCVGGKATLKTIAGMFEAKIKAVTGKKVKLLRAAA